MKRFSPKQRAYCWAALLITSLAVTGLAGVLFYESLTDTPDPWADLSLRLTAWTDNMTFIARHLTADHLPAFWVVNASFTVYNASTAHYLAALAWDPDDVFHLTITGLVVYSTTGRYRCGLPTTTPALPYTYTVGHDTPWWLLFAVTITCY